MERTGRTPTEPTEPTATTATARTGPTATIPTGPTAAPEAAFPGLAALVGKDEVGAFLGHDLGRNAYRTRLDRAAARRLFDWPDLNAALLEHRLAAPRLRLELAGKDVTRGLFRERRSRRGAVLQDADPAVLNARLGEGATLILDSADELNPALRRLCADLAAEFACACQANLYACWGSAQGFDVHWDDHDVFVVQIHGRKRWALYGATRAAPTRRDLHGEHPRPEVPIEETVLEPGDVLYLPRGYWHAAVGLGGPTMHLTIGLTRKTGADFLHWLADHALSEAGVRADLPLERDDAILAAHLAGVLARLAAEPPEVLARLYRRHVEANQAIRPQLSFPFIGGPETVLGPDTAIRLADGLARLGPGMAPGEVVLSWRGVEYAVDEALTGPLRALAGGGTVAYSAFEAAVAGGPPGAAAAFVRDMLRRGVFVLSEGPAPVNFCSRRSLEAHEVVAGTAVRGEAYVFLPVPKRFWRSGELNTGWARREELDAIRSARRCGIVARLYNPAGPEGEAAAILIHPREGASAPPAPLAALLAPFEGRWPRETAARPRLAVCTHGTRDRCCAKWGFAAWREARALYEAGRSPFEPIETSHLGGDRFAATGVVFPAGSMYAHLDAVDLPALLAGEADGRIAPAEYRGGVFEPQLAQIVRAGLAREGLFNDTAVPLVVALAEGRADLAHARAGGARFEVSLAETQVAFYGSCEDWEGGRASRVRRTTYVSARRL